MLPPTGPPPVLLPPGLLAPLLEPVFFLLLEQAASVAAAPTPPMPMSIERRLGPDRAPVRSGSSGLTEWCGPSSGAGTVSAMTPPRAVRGVAPRGAGYRCCGGNRNIFQRVRSEPLRAKRR